MLSGEATLVLPLEVLLAKEGRPMGQISDGDVRKDMLPFHRHNDVGGALLGIPGHMAGQ